MKKQLSLILLGLASASLSGCGGPKKVKVITTYDADGTMTNKETYSYKGDKVSEVVYDYVFDGKASKTKSVFEYDNNFLNKITSYFYNEESGVWGATYFTYLNYDTSGNKISEYETMVGEHGEVPFSVNLYTYDQNNRGISYESFDYYKGTLIFFIRVETEYDANGRVIKEKQYDISYEGEIYLACVYLHAYNDDGSVKSVSTCGPDETPYLVEKYVNDEKSKLPKEVTSYRIEEGSELPRVKMSYEYDSNNDMTKSTYSVFNDETNVFDVDSYMVYEY